MYNVFLLFINNSYWFIKNKNQEIVTLDLKLTRNAKISLAQEVYNVIMAETVELLLIISNQDQNWKSPLGCIWHLSKGRSGKYMLGTPIFLMAQSYSSSSHTKLIKSSAKLLSKYSIIAIPNFLFQPKVEIVLFTLINSQHDLKMFCKCVSR